MKVFVTLLTVLGLIFQRPMILGYGYSEFGLLLLLMSIALMAFVFRKVRVKRTDLSVFLTLCISIIFLSIVDFVYLREVIAIQNFAIRFISLLALSMAYWVSPFTFLNWSRNILRLIIISPLITIIISDFSVANLPSLESASFALMDRGDLNKFSIYFPLTTIPYVMTINENLILPRVTYFSIEPGVGVLIVFVWRLLESNLSGRP